MSKTTSQNISPRRQNPQLAWRPLAKGHASGALLPVHQHRTAQLVFALKGVMSIQTQSGRWTIPPQRALWIPAHHPHSIQMLTRTEMRTVYFQPSFVADCKVFVRQAEVHALVASTLIKEMVLGLCGKAHGEAMQSLMARLLLHALNEAECLPTHLPLPTSDGLRRAALVLVSTNQWQLQVDALACEAAMSERTFSRRFTAETGMSFRAWRQRARLIASLDLLASEQSIKSIAHAMHFQTQAAYAAAFGALFGQPPQEFRQSCTRQ